MQLPPGFDDDLGTDALHALMGEAVQELPPDNPVRLLWKRMDQILTDGGPECLPAPWDDDHDEWHLHCKAEIGRLEVEVHSLRREVTTHVGAAIQTVHQRGHDVSLPLPLLEYLTGGAETVAWASPRPLPRDSFEVVTNCVGLSSSAVDELRCSRYGAVTP